LITRITVEILSPQRHLMENIFGLDHDSSLGPLEFFNKDRINEIK
jgi:hypothetical protein